MSRSPFALLLTTLMLLATPCVAAETRWDVSYDAKGCVVSYRSKPDRSPDWTQAASINYSTKGLFGFVIQDVRLKTLAVLPLEIQAASGARFTGDAIAIDPKNHGAGYGLIVSGRKDLERALVGDLTFIYRTESGQRVSLTAPFGLVVPRTEACFARAAGLSQAAQGGASEDEAAGEADDPDPGLIATGSGVAVNLAGAVLTNAHVVEGCGRMVSPVLGEARVVAIDKASDLALLSFARHPTAAVTFRSGALKLGEPVLAAGFPLSPVLQNGLNVTTGNLSALAGPVGDRRMIQFTAPIQHGNSGGPLVDRSARLMGLVSASAKAELETQNINWAVALATIQSFLDENAVTYELGKEAPLSPEQIASRARTFTVPLECRK